MLVYGPTDLASTELIASYGHDVTVWDDDTWRAATAADFAAFELIEIGEQSCSGPGQEGELDALVDTAEVWNAVIDGRAVVSGIDVACHITDWVETAEGDASYPPRLHANTVSWLMEGCGTALSVSTDWGQRNLDHVDGTEAWSSVPQRGVAVQECLFVSPRGGYLSGPWW